MTEKVRPYLIVGLGNPGKEYDKTRHNVGFLALDDIVRSFDLPALKPKKEWQGEYVKTKLAGEETILFKPVTYMNLSGDAVQKVAHYFQILPARIIVIQDDIDLPVGKLRIRQGGQSGGHNGIKSVISAVGPDFIRIKIGVLAEEGKGEAVDLVLSRFSKKENIKIQESLNKVPEVIQTIFTEGLQVAQNTYNGASSLDV